MKKWCCIIYCLGLFFDGFAQSKELSPLTRLQQQKDSALHVAFHQDSLKIEKEFAEKMKWQKLKDMAQYPLLNAGENSLVVPVTGLTEVPDPNLDYKLLFELTDNNPDSAAKEINYGLTEIARKINLHVASGIPQKKIFPVIVVHAGALNAFTNNSYYQQRFKRDNPNIKAITDLQKLGAKFIACGQAMAFLNLNQSDLLPPVKIALTAQTVLSSYQLKGYVLFAIKN